MDARQLFLLLHERLQRTVEETFLHGLTDEQLRCRPRPGVNSLAWLLYHMARCEDIAVSRLVAGCPTLLAQGRWDLGLAARDIGTGMTGDEVDAFGERIDVPALRAYYAELMFRTRDIVICLPDAAWDEAPDLAYLRRVLEEDEALGPRTGWVGLHFEGRTRGWFLGQLALRHNVAHLAEGAYARGLIEAGAG